jgi:hypothetical protein
VSLVDLNAGTITTTCAVSSDAYDVALSSTGVAYVVPESGGFTPVHAIDFSSCAETLDGMTPIPARAALHPSQQALFLAEEGLTPSRVDRCDVTASTIECVDAEDGADWGVYELCGNLWLSADGARIYTACGVTLSVPQDVSVDACAYGGALDGVDAIQHMSEAPEVQRVVLIPGFASNDGPSDDSTPPGDMVIRVHETQYLGFVAQYELPPFPLPGAA